MKPELKKILKIMNNDISFLLHTLAKLIALLRDKEFGMISEEEYKERLKDLDDKMFKYLGRRIIDILEL